MQIHCPICSTSIDVSEDHAGHKGRCVNCSTKFIIPNDPEGNIEILERGETIQAQSESDSSAGPMEEGDEGSRAPALNVPALNVPAARSYTAVRPQFHKKSGSPMGFVFIVVLVLAVGVGVYFYLSDKKITIADTNSNSETVEKKAVKAPIKAPNKKSKISEEVNAPEVSESTVPFKVPISEDEVFEFTDEARDRSLEFLASNDQEKRESVYTAFRALGDNYKETYEELLRIIRNKHLISLNDKSSAIKKRKVVPEDIKNAYQEWKDVTTTGLNSVMTKWRETEPEEYKAKYLEMDEIVKNAEELYSGMVKAMEVSQGSEDESFQELVDLISELDYEIAWSLGEDDFSASEMNDLLNEAKSLAGEKDIVDSLSGELGKMQSIYLSNVEIETYNAQLNWGTSAYKKLVQQINIRRVSLGLEALRLDQTLTVASEVHSGDMHFQNYYSHRSADGTTYLERAKSAGFNGKSTGECLFRSSADPDVAYKSWWYNDSQRSIMFSSSSNAVGVGNAQNYWTLNTGEISQ
ncbi:MAG: CAP domain-containing protein [Verrucomicrobiales bacterium]|nr:CAP domain-containing protein [Verrucomicrobiales bacterium]